MSRGEDGGKSFSHLSAFTALCLGAPDSSLLLVSMDLGWSSWSIVCGHLALETVIREEANLLNGNGGPVGMLCFLELS